MAVDLHGGSLGWMDNHYTRNQVHIEGPGPKYRNQVHNQRPGPHPDPSLWFRHQSVVQVQERWWFWFSVKKQVASESHCELPLY